MRHRRFVVAQSIFVDTVGDRFICLDEIYNEEGDFFDWCFGNMKKDCHEKLIVV